MIDLDAVSFWYEDTDEPILRDVSVHIGEGELVLMAGRTGSGKSTLLNTFNGLVPYFTGGHLEGTVRVCGTSTAKRPPREFAHLVGMVGQDPLAGFVTDTVEEELAYGMEQLGVAAQVMRRRVEETLDLLGIAELRHRALHTLSGGQQQRVAIGSVLTMHPPVLVLDEPTSALDPTAAEEVLATLARLVADLGTTVIMAEHRLERVIPFADRMLFVNGDGSVQDGEPAAILTSTPIAPPIVSLGRLARWDPLPLSVRDARRHASGLRTRLSHVPIPHRSDPQGLHPVLQARQIVVKYGAKVAVRGVDLDLHPGKVLALMGRNGSGKSSLLWAIQGSGPRHSGHVTVGGQAQTHDDAATQRPLRLGVWGAVKDALIGKDPTDLSSSQARRLVGLVPQSASDLLYLETVGDECAMADQESTTDDGYCRSLLDVLAPGISDDKHPRDLSEGQRLALVLAVQLTAAPPVVLLDEPTRGLDYPGKAALARMIAMLKHEGRTVVVATHDVEFMATVADRVIVMAEGEFVSDGPADEVLGASPAFAPQVAKILGQEWLTVAEVEHALAGA